MGYVLEACVDSVQSAIKAQEGGATRLELCANLIIGGTTPGRALFQQVRENKDLEIRVLLRPRFGNYQQDDSIYRDTLLSCLGEGRNRQQDAVSACRSFYGASGI